MAGKFPVSSEPNAVLVAELPLPADTEVMTDSTKLAAAEWDLTGRKLGDYRLLRKLGRGGMDCWMRSNACFD